MSRIFDGKTLVLASHNTGKLEELTRLFAPYQITIISMRALNLPEPDEPGDSFEANAKHKALAAARAAAIPALADDSGLSVRALGGAPGIYSARWAGPTKDFHAAMQKVHDQLVAGSYTDYAADFVCALCLAWPDGHTETVRAACAGQIIWPPRGTGGFGYDPFFVPDSTTQTEPRSFGEMTMAQKQQFSHRAKALARLMDQHFVKAT